MSPAAKTVNELLSLQEPIAKIDQTEKAMTVKFANLFYHSPTRRDLYNSLPEVKSHNSITQHHLCSFVNPLGKETNAFRFPCRHACFIFVRRYSDYATCQWLLGFEVN
ncbi:MAG: hypothetical protein NZ937_07440 [Armatimonadetes bacterium]|nr:hypothetical protein [Armatimonadota bacterium]